MDWQNDGFERILDLNFNGTPADFAAAAELAGIRLYDCGIDCRATRQVDSGGKFAEVLFFRAKLPDEPIVTAGRVEARIAPGGKTRLTVRIADSDFTALLPVWETVFTELKGEGWFESESIPSPQPEPPAPELAAVKIADLPGNNRDKKNAFARQMRQEGATAAECAKAIRISLDDTMTTEAVYKLPGWSEGKSK